MIGKMYAQYADAYKEVLVVLRHMKKSDFEKIPKEYIEYFIENYNKDYKFKYDDSKTLEQQTLMKETRYILYSLYEKFGTTKEQKNEISAYRYNYNNVLEEKKMEKYNPEKLFSTMENRSSEIDTNQGSMIISKKKNIFQRIFSKIFNGKQID